MACNKVYVSTVMKKTGIKQSFTVGETGARIHGSNPQLAFLKEMENSEKQRQCIIQDPKASSYIDIIHSSTPPEQGINNTNCFHYSPPPSSSQENVPGIFQLLGNKRLKTTERSLKVFYNIRYSIYLF